MALIPRFILLSAATAVLLFSCKKEPVPCCDPNPNDTTATAYGTPFDQVPAAEDVVMYEVNPLVFSTSRDLAGVTARLDSIRDLGVNVVWLMPIYEKGVLNSVGSPYCIANYTKVNANYGTLDDLRTLVDSAHSKGMAVMLDWVANHTSWDHEWMNDPSNYVRVNGEIIHPPGTNWADVAELDYSNQQMRQAMIEAMKYWILEANVDGYRCDYATGVPEDFWKAAIDSLRALPGRDLLLFAESDQLSLLDQGFDMAFSWSLYGTLLNVFQGGDAKQLFQSHQSEFSTLAPGKTTVRFVSNHDQHAWDGTPQQLFGGGKQVLAAFAVATTLGGVPLIYNGQEKAVPYQLPFFTPTNVAINWNLNPQTTSAYRALLSAYREYDAFRGNVRTNHSTFQVAAYSSSGTGHEGFVAVNVRSTAMSLVVPDAWKNKTVFDVLSQDSVALGTSLSLDPLEYRLLVK